MSVTPAQTDALFTIRRDGQAVVLGVAADLAEPAAREVRAAILDLLETRPGRLLIDLAHVQAVDETGLGVLLVTSLWARKLCVEVAVNPSPAVRQRLTTARLHGYLTLVEPG